MDDDPIDTTPGKTFIGGRHGSPSVSIAFPFSKIANVDSELRELLEELTGLVARLASASSDAERAEVATAARDLLERVAPAE